MRLIQYGTAVTDERQRGRSQLLVIMFDFSHLQSIIYRHLQLLHRARVFIQRPPSKLQAAQLLTRHGCRENRVLPRAGLRPARPDPRVPWPGRKALQSGCLGRTEDVRPTCVRQVGCAGFRAHREQHGGTVRPRPASCPRQVAEAAGQRQDEALEDWQPLLRCQRKGT